MEKKLAKSQSSFVSFSHAMNNEDGANKNEEIGEGDMVSTELTAEQVIEKKEEEERLRVLMEKEKAEKAEKEAREKEEEKEMISSQNLEMPKRDMTATNMFDTLADNLDNGDNGDEQEPIVEEETHQ